MAGAGCSSGHERLTIAGSVSIHGKRVNSGIVKLHGPGDRLSMATIDAEGTFTVTDVFPGEIHVTVEENLDRRKHASMTRAPRSTNARASVDPVAIPPKYWDVKTSGLVYDITPQTRTLDIDLP
jgi:hypothetical protein